MVPAVLCPRDVAAPRAVLPVARPGGVGGGRGDRRVAAFQRPATQSRPRCRMPQGGGSATMSSRWTATGVHDHRTGPSHSSCDAVGCHEGCAAVALNSTRFVAKVALSVPQRLRRCRPCDTKVAHLLCLSRLRELALKQHLVEFIPRACADGRTREGDLLQGRQPDQILHRIVRDGRIR